MPHRYLLSLADAPSQRAGEPYRDLDAWIRDAADLDKVEDPRFCHVLRKAGPVAPQGPTGGGDPLTQLREGLSSRKAARDVPWVTLVLGSECLEIHPRAFDMEASLDALEVGLTTILESDKRRAGLVVEFVRSLLRERLGAGALRPARRRRPSNSTKPQVGFVDVVEWKLRLVEAAAILNHLYFAAKAEQRRAVSRWNDGEVPLLGTPGVNHAEGRAKSEAADVYEEVQGLSNRLSLLRQSLAHARTPVDVTHVQSLVSRIHGGLGDLRGGSPVNVADVQALTEVAWATLVLHTDVYPPWPELLVDLCLQSGSRGIRDGGLRPSFLEANYAAGHLKTLLTPATKVSAAAHDRNHRRKVARADDSSRHGAYGEYARILVEQAKWSKRAIDGQFELTGGMGRRDDDGAPLVASAFVTTFDVELEMALRSRFPKQPFVVAVPVHVVGALNKDNPTEKRATSLWLGYLVKPSEEDLLSAVTRPKDEDWFVLSSADFLADTTSPGSRLPALPDGFRTLNELPFVVRLGGSPLVKLPALGGPGEWNDATRALRHRALELSLGAGPEAGEGLIEAMEWPELREMDFVHAPVLEEHHSMRLIIPEIGVPEARGLPRALTRLGSQGSHRYWLLLGVQLSDSVVRLRLMAQLFSAGFFQADPQSHYRRPSRAGAAVNVTKLSPRATDLLEWSEFDLVHARLEQVTAHLRHYGDHLAATSGLTSWPASNTECTVR